MLLSQDYFCSPSVFSLRSNPPPSPEGGFLWLQVYINADMSKATRPSLAKRISLLKAKLHLCALNKNVQTGNDTIYCVSTIYCAVNPISCDFAKNQFLTQKQVKKLKKQAKNNQKRAFRLNFWLFFILLSITTYCSLLKKLTQYVVFLLTRGI